MLLSKLFGLVLGESNSNVPNGHTLFKRREVCRTRLLHELVGSLLPKFSPLFRREAAMPVLPIHQMN